MKKLLSLMFLLMLPQVGHATSFADARTITNATSGKVLSMQTVSIASLSNAQKAALVTFITSLGASWPGVPANITAISLYRMDDNPNVLGAVLQGLIVHNDATTAVNQLTSGVTSSILGIVP